MIKKIMKFEKNILKVGRSVMEEEKRKIWKMKKR